MGRATSAALMERAMVERRDGRIVETPREARQAERGPSILTVLIASVVLAVIILGLLWAVFFRT
jgi:hypothetical protein